MIYYYYSFWWWYDRSIAFYNFILIMYFLYKSFSKIKKTKKIIDHWVFVEIK